MTSVPGTGRGLGSLGAAIFVTAAVVLSIGVAGVEEFKRSIVRRLEKIDAGRTLPVGARPFGGAYILDIDRQFAPAASAFVGDGESYELLFGRGTEYSASLTRRFATVWARGGLLPSRAEPAETARWLPCYDCVRVGREIEEEAQPTGLRPVLEAM